MSCLIAHWLAEKLKELVFHFACSNPLQICACMHMDLPLDKKKTVENSELGQRTRGCWAMDLLLGKPTLPLLENVLPSSFPTYLAMPCTSPHTESNCRQDGAWSNFCQIKKQRCQAKRQKTSETEQENCRKFESNKRKRAFYPSWKESFCSSSIMLHVCQ